MEKVTLTVNLDTNVRDALERQAKEKDRSMSWVVNDMLSRKLKLEAEDKE